MDSKRAGIAHECLGMALANARPIWFVKYKNKLKQQCFSYIGVLDDKTQLAFGKASVQTSWHSLASGYW